MTSAMMRNPHLKVLVAAGYYDLATPYLSADYTVNRLQSGPDPRRNITQVRYRAGHMMYHDAESLEKLRDDAARLIEAAAGEAAMARNSRRVALAAKPDPCPSAPHPWLILPLPPNPE